MASAPPSPPAPSPGELPKSPCTDPAWGKGVADGDRSNPCLQGCMEWPSEPCHPTSSRGPQHGAGVTCELHSSFAGVTLHPSPPELCRSASRPWGGGRDSGCDIQGPVALGETQAETGSPKPSQGGPSMVQCRICRGTASTRQNPAPRTQRLRVRLALPAGAMAPLRTDRWMDGRPPPTLPLVRPVGHPDRTAISPSSSCICLQAHTYLFIC